MQDSVGDMDQTAIRGAGESCDGALDLAGVFELQFDQPGPRLFEVKKTSDQD